MTRKPVDVQKALDFIQTPKSNLPGCYFNFQALLFSINLRRELEFNQQLFYCDQCKRYLLIDQERHIKFTPFCSGCSIQLYLCSEYDLKKIISIATENHPGSSHSLAHYDGINIYEPIQNIDTNKLKLASLIGSDKQISWAKRIRNDKIFAVQNFFSHRLDSYYDDIDNKLFQILIQEKSSKFWIDRRDLTEPELLVNTAEIHNINLDV